jgi:hypothetical protein
MDVGKVKHKTSNFANFLVTPIYLLNYLPIQPCQNQLVRVKTISILQKSCHGAQAQINSKQKIQVKKIKQYMKNNLLLINSE